MKFFEILNRRKFLADRIFGIFFHILIPKKFLGLLILGDLYLSSKDKIQNS